MFDAIHLSDLHLGSSLCQVEKIISFLDTLPETQRLILGGDILEGTHGRLGKNHWRVLSKLRSLSDDLELIWVTGNHDWDAESVAHLVGASFVNEWMYSSGEKFIFTIHGHIWDEFIRNYPFTTWIADQLNLLLQRLCPRWVRFVRRNSKTFLHCREKVRKGGISFMRERGGNIVICGHTHSAECWASGYECIPYYVNTGSWTEEICHYATVLDGKVELVAYGCA